MEPADSWTKVVNIFLGSDSCFLSSVLDPLAVTTLKISNVFTTSFKYVAISSRWNLKSAQIRILNCFVSKIRQIVVVDERNEETTLYSGNKSNRWFFASVVQGSKNLSRGVLPETLRRGPYAVVDERCEDTTLNSAVGNLLQRIFYLLTTAWILLFFGP